MKKQGVFHGHFIAAENIKDYDHFIFPLSTEKYIRSCNHCENTKSPKIWYQIVPFIVYSSDRKKD